MTTTSVPAIAVAGLRRSSGGQVVLDGIDLTVPAGSVFALLGPNGAGKTTTPRTSTKSSYSDGRSAGAPAGPSRAPGGAGLTATTIGGIIAPVTMPIFLFRSEE